MLYPLLSQKTMFEEKQVFFPFTLSISNWEIMLSAQEQGKVGKKKIQIPLKKKNLHNTFFNLF